MLREHWNRAVKSDRQRPYDLNPGFVPGENGQFMDLPDMRFLDGILLNDAIRKSPRAPLGSSKCVQTGEPDFQNRGCGREIVRMAKSLWPPKQPLGRPVLSKEEIGRHVE